MPTPASRQSPAAKFERKSPFNFGAEYRLTEGITLGGYWMYGDAVGSTSWCRATPTSR